MFRSELDNFVVKFHQLLRAGYTAHLDLDANAGQAWVGLRVMLGSSHQQQQYQPHQAKHRSPSYFRRQERRRAAKENAEEATPDAENSNSEEISKNNSDTVQVSDSISEYKCDKCEFSSNRETGLKIHKTKKHASIEQVDGNDSISFCENEADLLEYYKDNDEDLEEYYQTGELKSYGVLWDALLFDIYKYSSDPGKELLVALEAKRKAIEKENGIGSYMEWSPWNDIFA